MEGGGGSVSMCVRGVGGHREEALPAHHRKGCHRKQTLFIRSEMRNQQATKTGVHTEGVHSWPKLKLVTKEEPPGQGSCRGDPACGSQSPLPYKGHAF